MAREKKADKFVRALAVAERMNSHYGEAACALHYTTPFTHHCCSALRSNHRCGGEQGNTRAICEIRNTPSHGTSRPRRHRTDHPVNWVLPNQSKNCIACAQMIMSDFGGEVPRDMDQMQSFPE